MYKLLILLLASSALAGNPPIQGRGVVTTFTQNYGTTSVTTAAFTTIIGLTSQTINEEDIFDTSGNDYFLSYAPTCGTLSTSTNSVIVSAGGGGKDFVIPSGQCVGVKAKTANITSGSVNMTFYQ